MIRPSLILSIILLTSSITGGQAAPAAGISKSLEAILSVGPEGKGNADASKAWKSLSDGDSSTLPELLKGMAGANDLAANWIRAAVETIADRAARSGTPLPLPELGTFLLDTRNDPRARDLAFELIRQEDPATGEQLLGGMLNDPSGALRRLAVERVVQEARKTLDAGNKTGATLLYQQALASARAPDQLQHITGPLKDLGQTVDLPSLFGFITEWKVIGPFDSTGGRGFEAVYPPETAIDLKAQYPGKQGEVKWVELITGDSFGMVDINKPLGKLKEAAAYAYTEFYSDAPQAAELRLGCKNAWKIWLNDEFVFGRDEYHRGMEIDQYQMPVRLKPGANRILVKLCQNEMTEDWTVEWQFQLRVCDPLGTPIHSANLKAAKLSTR